MSLVRWDPFANITTLQDRINRLFEDAFPRGKEEDEDLSVYAWRPLVDIYDTETGVAIIVDLPGVQKDEVSVEVKENVLTIKGDRKPEQVVQDKKYYRRERTCGSFHRSFALRGMVAPDSIKATFKNGELKIELPKPKQEKPKQVSVTID
jgi:HSP20 family protein